MELWGAEMKTNIEAVVEYSMSKTRSVDPVIKLLLEIYSDVEMQDLLVGKATIVKRGKRITLRAQSQKIPKTKIFKTEMQMQLSKCRHCGQLVYVEEGSPEKQKEFHEKGCPVVDMIEVMEG